MPTVKFTRHLRRFFPALETVVVEGRTVAEVVNALDAVHPGLAGYLVDDRGALRKHVNIFVEDEMVADRRTLSDAVTEESRLFVMQALSGG